MIVLQELQGSVNEAYCKIKFKRRVHSRAVKKIVHVARNNCIISCSSDCDASIVIRHNKGIMDSYTFKIQRGVSCFHYSEFLNLLVTGGTDRRLRLWEPVITIRPSAIFPIQSAKIIDVIFLAHLHAIMSFNKNGVLKLWNIFNQVCIQSINIQFPSFGILGKPIQFGFESIYCGPARASQKLEFENSTQEPPEYKEYVKWSRPEIVVTCCNHMAILPMSNESILKSAVDIIKREADNDDVEYALLPPPERNHCPRRPSLWNDQQLDDVKDEITDEVEESVKEENAVEFDIKFDVTPLEELLARNGLSGILEKDFLNEIGQKHNLSSKLIIHNSKQEKMRLPVSQGAPFTALDLQQHTDIIFSTRLPLSIRMQKKSGLEYFDNPQQILRHNSCFSMTTLKSNYTTLAGDEAEPQSDEE
ncbi:uncharacterized protein LOC143911608 [Arctopsyche grandis]|uniref:uncharacterized protein LOC143911608 n=1 Tax=Arctopsyche grandis TaxID=121162 RepID=UPI00406D7359